MGEEPGLLRADDNPSLRVEPCQERITGDAGAILVREVIERLGVGRRLNERLIDPRHPLLITLPQMEVVHTSLLLLAQGWRDQDDADLLRHDPVARLAVSTRRGIVPLKMRPRAGNVRTAARVLIHGGRAILILGHISGAYWPVILPKLRMLRFAEVE